MKESQIQKAILNYLTVLERMGKVYFARVGSGMIRTQAGGFFKSGKRGCADILLVAAGGQFIAVEVKTETGRQTPEQKEAEKLIKKLGGAYIIARSLDDIMAVIK